MMAYVNGIVTAIGLLTFLGIVAWAWSKGRAQANHDASLIPFEQPDECSNESSKGGSE